MLSIGGALKCFSIVRCHTAIQNTLREKFQQLQPPLRKKKEVLQVP